MSSTSLAWGAPEWAGAAVAAAAIAVVLLLTSYYRAPVKASVRWAAASLKAIGVAALAICLVEPLLSGERPRPGANIFVVAVDDSESLTVKDEGADESRADQLSETLDVESPWRTRLSQQFDVRAYAFDSHLRGVDELASLSFEGSQTSLNAALAALRRRFDGLPLAGVLLFTDGVATDVVDPASWEGLPPVYPVLVGDDEAPPDVRVTTASVSQTNFESAPVTIRADVDAAARPGETLVAQLLDRGGAEVQRQTTTAPDDDAPASFRFQFRPDSPGVSFYTVRTFVEGELPAFTGEGETDEATLANNERVVAVDRGGGPFRVLYVCGRPNWEFKFLRRALDGDEQLELVGLVRMARRQPKFSFQRRGSERVNPLFEDFQENEVETAERYDEPVLLRLGIREDDPEELRGGFPTEAKNLYQYDAIVLDDVEAEFFSQDQLTLLEQFVSRRGGGFLMLGGFDSYAEGGYDRTPVGSMLPVYLTGVEETPRGGSYSLALTREGWLEPWVRTRKTEPEERRRLDAMSRFAVLSRVGRLKPGATVLAEVVDGAGERRPALVSQRFGAGRAAAIMIGDLWRWSLRRQDAAEDDFERAWRQTVRWLVGDVPQRLDAMIRPLPESPSGAVEVFARVRDEEYLPLDNARVKVRVALPGGREILLDAEQTDEAGAYAASFIPREAGPYLATVTALSPEGEEVGVREAGWAAQGAADEYRTLRPDRAAATRIAEATGGEVLGLADLERFTAGLSGRAAPITERWFYPLWHTWVLFAVAVAALAGEWGLRRIKGLA